jgi:hypothetical protein
MTALTAAARLNDDVEAHATINVRVTEPAHAPRLVSFLDQLGLRAFGEPNGTVRIHPWADVEWHEARVEILMCVDSWVRNNGVPVQLT